jgi:hypothetical protein
VHGDAILYMQENGTSEKAKARRGTEQRETQVMPMMEVREVIKSIVSSLEKEMQDMN